MPRLHDSISVMFFHPFLSVVFSSLPFLSSISLVFRILCLSYSRSLSLSLFVYLLLSVIFSLSPLSCFSFPFSALFFPFAYLSRLPFSVTCRLFTLSCPSFHLSVLSFLSHIFFYQSCPLFPLSLLSYLPSMSSLPAIFILFPPFSCLFSSLLSSILSL